jgi:hypothetical protein
MTAALAWIVLPLLLALLSLGCGLLVEVAAGVELPLALVVPTGFAAVVVASQFPPLAAASATAAAPLVVALAIVGFGLSGARLRTLFSGWPLGAAAAVFGSYAAPVALSGAATFAGYIKLDDTATYLAMLDRVESHGRGVAGLAPSTYEATLATSLDYGYPLGSFTPLGVLQRLLNVDAAWLWQPYLAVLGAFLALALYALMKPVIASRPVRAAAAFVAAQPAILYGYALWGGIKELVAALLLVVLCACIRPALEGARLRSVLPLAVSAAALLGALSVGGAIWLTPLAGAVILVYRDRGPVETLRRAAAFVCSTAVLAIPAIVAALEWLGHSGAFTSDTELGNLIRPLGLVQVAGIWPVGDFRRVPADLTTTYVLVAVVALAAAGGVVWTVARRAWEPLLYVAGALVAALALDVAGSPWIAAKALATASPALLAAAAIGVAAVFTTRRFVEGAVVALAIVGGVAWSNVLAYREAWLAPRSRLAELASIGSRYAGQGPALMTEFEPYGARHFLRRLDAEGASELRRDVVPLRSGQPVPPEGYADVDRFSLRPLLVFRTLVLRRSPVESRPPAAYRLVDSRRWYDVWQRSASPPRVLAHLPLGSALDPAAVPSCAHIARLARVPGARRLVGVPREPVQVIGFPATGLPRGWSPGADPGSVDPRASAGFGARIAVPRTGRYGVWVGGSFAGAIAISVDGRPIGDARHQLEWTGQFVEIGAARLAAGSHRLEIRYTVGGWRPGSDALAPFPLGPLAVAPDDPGRLVSVTPDRSRRLCGRRLDWVEAVG